MTSDSEADLRRRKRKPRQAATPTDSFTSMDTAGSVEGDSGERVSVLPLPDSVYREPRAMHMPAHNVSSVGAVTGNVCVNSANGTRSRPNRSAAASKQASCKKQTKP